MKQFGKGKIPYRTILTGVIAVFTLFGSFHNTAMAKDHITTDDPYMPNETRRYFISCQPAVQQQKEIKIFNSPNENDINEDWSGSWSSGFITYRDFSIDEFYYTNNRQFARGETMSGTARTMYYTDNHFILTWQWNCSIGWD